MSYALVQDEAAIRDEKGRYISADPLHRPRKVIESSLRRAAMRSPQALDNACMRLIDSAANGETWQERIAAFKEVADRLDGKAVARIETSEGAPRELGLADLVALVLNARKTDAVDTITTSPNDQSIVSDAHTRNDSSDS